jgi:hypothetical protein
MPAAYEKGSRSMARESAPGGFLAWVHYTPAKKRGRAFKAQKAAVCLNGKATPIIYGGIYLCQNQ